MGLLRKCPFQLTKVKTEHPGARALKNMALLLMTVTVIGWICGWVSPLILAPVYIAVACCMYMRLRHVRLIGAVTMLSHLAYTLLHLMMNATLYPAMNPLQRFEGIMQKAYCIFYLAVVLYLYISPSIAEYYQERRNEN